MRQVKWKYEFKEKRSNVNMQQLLKKSIQIYMYIFVIFLKVNDGIKLGCLIPWATSENLYNG